MNHFYFDHNATTPVSPEVLAGFTSCLAEVYGNASSIHHFGQAAKHRLELARRQVAGLIQSTAKEVIFVSGGTEADNLALLGVVRNSPRRSKHIITTAIEHPAVLNTCAQLAAEHVAVDYIPVGSSGVVDPAEIGRALRPDTVLVSVMHANNELGTIQPIAEIGRITREAGVYLHCDGVQAAGRIPIRVDQLGVDLYSLSGHKMYAPKGIGALYVRDKTRTGSIQFGGHHERERRPGTENVPGAAAMGMAANHKIDAEIAALRDRLEAGILDRVPNTRVNAAASPRLPNTTNVCFDFIEGEAMVIALDLRGFAVSSGSACSSGAVEPSHVLTAIGLSPEQARSCIRFSLGRTNTIEQVDALIDAVASSAGHLRRIAPLKVG